MRIIIALTGWTALMLLAGAVAAQSGFGDYTDHRRPGGLNEAQVAVISEAVEAYNSQDPARIQRFIRENFSAEFAAMEPNRHLSAWAASFGRTGPLEFAAVRTYDEPREELVAIARAPVIESWQAIVLMPGEGGRFESMYFAPARPLSYLEPAEPLSPDAAARKLGEMIDRLAERDMFSGTVMVVRGQDVLLMKSAGLASRRFNVPNEKATRFNIGSMNKMFTAIAIAQLEEAGKLCFDDYVGEHLPEYPNDDVRTRVQIRHLLSHSSGMGSHFTKEFMEGSKTRFREFGDYLPLFQDRDLEFEPGMNWAYSNAGYFVLGLVVEAVSGMSYYDYVREHIYAPAGMRRTDSYDMDIPVPNLAIGYTRSGMGNMPGDGMRWLTGTGGFRNNLFMHSIKGGPAGGGYSTAPDLVAFARALTDGTLVSRETLADLTTPKPDLASPAYGFGFETEELPVVGRRFGHGGGFPGINAILEIYPDQDLTFVALANLDGAAGLLARRFAELITRGR